MNAIAHAELSLWQRGGFEHTLLDARRLDGGIAARREAGHAVQPLPRGAS